MRSKQSRYAEILDDGRGLYAYGAKRRRGGATSGSGTDKCARCRDDKEKVRLNFMFCTKCDAIRKANKTDEKKWGYGRASSRTTPPRSKRSASIYRGRV